MKRYGIFDRFYRIGYIVARSTYLHNQSQVLLYYASYEREYITRYEKNYYPSIFFCWDTTGNTHHRRRVWWKWKVDAAPNSEESPRIQWFLLCPHCMELFSQDSWDAEKSEKIRPTYASGSIRYGIRGWLHRALSLRNQMSPECGDGRSLWSIHVYSTCTMICSWPLNE